MTENTQHVLNALLRLPEQHRDKETIRALLTALASPAQELETAWVQLFNYRSVDLAEGVQLDRLGEIVGQPRNGLSDDDYRRYIRAKIKTNRSNGVTPDLIAVTELVVGDEDLRVEIDNQGIATVVVRARDIALADEIAEVVNTFLQEAKSGGVRLIFEYSEFNEANTFTFSDDSSVEDPNTTQGFAEDTTPSSGGYLAAALD